MQRKSHRLTKLFFLLIATQWLSGCSALKAAKPALPIEQGMTVYTITQPSAPTVLLFPGCGGAHGEEVKEIFPRKAKWLNEHGFNAVAFDYTKVMGVDNACLGQIKVDTLLKLATAAFAYTAKQPFVDHKRIILLGWSMGASMALTVAQNLQTDDDPNIAGVAAYYPGCYPGLKLSTHPTLLLLGLADNVVNPYECLTLATNSPQTPLRLRTYMGAHHNFDIIEFKEPQSAHFLWKTFTSAYDAEAEADAEKTLLDFLQVNSAN